jgi:hypothetical protein
MIIGKSKFVRLKGELPVLFCILGRMNICRSNSIPQILGRAEFTGLSKLFKMKTMVQNSLFYLYENEYHFEHPSMILLYNYLVDECDNYPSAMEFMND